MALNWKASSVEYGLAGRIAMRAIKFDDSISPLSVEMDILATHLNGCPLRLSDLYNADDANFGHDVFGIIKNLDRDTGKLKNSFHPRYAKKQ